MRSIFILKWLYISQVFMSAKFINQNGGNTFNTVFRFVQSIIDQVWDIFNVEQ